MPSKTSRFRGSRTHGRGAKAGRGKGKRGGFGNAGMHKHKFKWMLKYDPDHFGRHGFKRPQGIIGHDRTINISEVEEKLAGYLITNSAKHVEGKIQVDLGALGYDKLLGTGHATLPLTIIVPCASTRAVEKLKKAGGVIVAEVVTAEKKRVQKPPAGPPAGARPAPAPKGGKDAAPKTPKPAKTPAPSQPKGDKAGPASKKQP
jgi:large subunit ribosomal protein L15